MPAVHATLVGAVVLVVATVVPVGSRAQPLEPVVQLSQGAAASISATTGSGGELLAMQGVLPIPKTLRLFAGYGRAFPEGDPSEPTNQWTVGVARAVGSASFELSVLARGVFLHRSFIRADPFFDTDVSTEERSWRILVGLPAALPIRVGESSSISPFLAPEVFYSSSRAREETDGSGTERPDDSVGIIATAGIAWQLRRVSIAGWYSTSSWNERQPLAVGDSGTEVLGIGVGFQF